MISFTVQAKKDGRGDIYKDRLYLTEAMDRARALLTEGWRVTIWRDQEDE